MIRPERLLLLGLWLACTPDPDAATLAILRHRWESGDVLTGPLARELAPRLGVQPSESGSLWVGPAEGPPGAGWVRVPGAASQHAVYRKRTPAPAEAVLLSDLAGDTLDHPIFSVAKLHGPARPGGVLLAEMALRLPARHPTRTCLVGHLQGTELDFGELLDGGVPVPPGEGPTPWIRARVAARLPGDMKVGPSSLALSLVHCVTRTPLAPPATWNLTVGGWGDPEDEAWIMRSGTALAGAAWPARPAPRTALHRQPDGTMEVREGPPLPRVERGQAWGLLVTAPWDPSGWDSAAVADPTRVGPITGLVPLFEEADAAVFTLDAPATRAGRRARVGPPPARRVEPSIFRLFRESGLDGVLAGPRVHDAGPEGWLGTWAEASAAGLAFGPSTLIDVGDGERAVRVALVPTTPDRAAEDLQAARVDHPNALVIAHLEGPATLELVALVAAHADAGQILGDGATPGPVMVWDGVPVWMGMPRIGAVEREGWAVRWYVAPEGVVRADLVGLVQRGDRWERDVEGALQSRLLDVAAQSAELGTEVVVGRSVAAIDVRAHAPDVGRGPFSPGGPVPQAPALPAPTTCAVPPEAQVVGTELGDSLVVESASRAGDRLRVVWRAVGPLVRPEVSLSTPDGSWKVRFRPCEGAEGPETWKVGQRGVDVVDLQQLGAPPPDGSLLLQVKDNGEALLPRQGSRWLTIP